MNRTAPPEWDLLLIAAQKNRPEEIREMVKSGVNPSHCNVVGQSALHVAALWGHVEAVQALLEAGANVNAKNNLTGATPLHMAVQSSKAGIEEQGECIDLLIQYGADAAETDQFGSLAVEYVIQQDPNSPLVAKLQPKAPDIIVAIEGGDLERVQQLLSDSSSCLQSKYRGQTPLTFAVEVLLVALEKGDDEEGLSRKSTILHVLLDAGSDPNVADSSDEGGGDVPLFRVLASLRQAYKTEEESSSSTFLLEETAIRLQEAGAALTPEISQLLHQAARRNEMLFAKFLVKRLCVNPNIRNRQDMTPLHFAARSGQIEVLRYLLALDSIDVDARDDRGHTALDAAQVNQKEQAVEILQAHNPTTTN